MPPPSQAWLNDAAASMTTMAQFDPGMNALNPTHRGHIANNVWRMSEDYPGAGFYEAFFRDTNANLGRIPANQVANHRLRVSNVFLSKLVAPYKNEKSLGSYLGGASEILDTISSIERPLAVPDRVAMPTANKTFEQVDWTTIGKATVCNPLEQDVDRTEVHGQVKYYIEVKADAHTAFQKIHTAKSTAQMDRILAVIANRVRRAQQANGETTHHNRHGYTLRPAISLTNPVGWLEYFSSGIVLLYEHRGFYLMTGGQVITPAQQRTVYEGLWTLCGLTLPAKNYYLVQNHLASRDKMAALLGQRSAAFPTPATLAGANWLVAGLVTAPV